MNVLLNIYQPFYENFVYSISSNLGVNVKFWGHFEHKNEYKLNICLSVQFVLPIQFIEI